MTRKLALIALIILSAVYCLLFTAKLLLADIYFAQGLTWGSAGYFETAIPYFQKAVSLNPREPAYHREFAFVLSQLRLLELADYEAQIAYGLNPRNSLTLKSIIKTYYDLAQIDEKYQEPAENLAQEMVALSPTDAKAYYNLALVLLRGEKVDAALAVLERAVELRPSYQEAIDLKETLTYTSF